MSDVKRERSGTGNGPDAAWRQETVRMSGTVAFSFYYRA